MKPSSRTQERKKGLALRRRTLVSSIRRLVCLPWLLAIGLVLPSVADVARIFGVRADDFLSSIGINSAVSRRGENLASTVNAARYLGLRWFRSGYESGIPIADLIELHHQTGVRFSYGLLSGGADMARLLDGARQLASAGAPMALEGNNEPNNWGVTYEGQRGGHTNTWLPVGQLRRALYRAVKSDPVLKDYPVWSLSENGAQVDNVGLQFLTIPSGAGTLMPDDTRYADYANCHNYMTHPGWPGLHDNQTWVAADPTSACRVDGLYGNYGLTWRHRYPGYSEPSLLTLPRVTTETGITIEGAITEPVQALLYLSVYLDQFKRGWKHTAIYLLRDRTDEGGNQTCGFYRPDDTPRLAATYLHNLTTILADKASSTTPDELRYSIPSQPATVHDLLLQKSDGRFELVVWDERFTGGSDEVTVSLGRAFPSVTLFDPTIGTSPIQSLSQAGSVELTVSNHPVIIEMPAQTRDDRSDGLGGTRTDAAQTPIKGPLRPSKNPNYFADPGCTPLILCGSHTWNTLQDWGTHGSIQRLDFEAFVSFLKAHGHNFTLLWCTELPKFRGLPTTDTSPPDFTVSPHPWRRTGPGTATDGDLKFDLTKYDQTYFDRLRARVEVLNRAGIYVGVYLFTGEFLLRFRSATDGYPFSGPNNVNGVDDGYRGGSPASAVSAVTMTAPNAITDLQDAYVRKTVDTLNDLPNVLWIVSEEAPSQSIWWNNHLISLLRAYERGKRFQHPIGYATLENPSDSILYNSDADWVAPWAWTSPTTSCGSGNPSCKVNLNDSDHSYFGMWNDPPQKNRNYAWENFTTGNQVLFMDPYLVCYPRQQRNLCLEPVNGIGTKPDPRWENFRNNLGYILQYSRKLNLANVTPRSSLCSTKYCLAQTPSVGTEYLVYAPSGGTFTMDLSAMAHSRVLTVEWFNPETGMTVSQGPIVAGSSSQSFNTPFSGDAVLYLVDKAGHK